MKEERYKEIEYREDGIPIEVGKDSLHAKSAGLVEKTCTNRHIYFRKELVCEAPNLFERHFLDRYGPRVAARYVKERDAAKARCRANGGDSEELDKIRRLWGKADAYYECLTESTVGESFRFSLGKAQPKVRPLSLNGKVFILSKYLKEAKTLYDFLSVRDVGYGLKNHVYLEKYPQGLMLSMAALSSDLHSRQVLVIGNKAIFIDFGYAARSGSWNKDPSLDFNFLDLRFQPLLKGVFRPSNWLAAKTRDNDPVEEDSYYFEQDPKTYQNPRFQNDAHKGLLIILLTPEELYSEINERQKGILQEGISEETEMLDVLSEVLVSRLVEGRRKVINESAKIPEFIDYLKNITLEEINEIAKEFNEFIVENQKHQKLKEILGKSPAEVFQKCVERLKAILRSSPYNFSEDDMSMQLIWMQSSQEKGSDKIPRLESQFCHADHLLKLGQLRNRQQLPQELPPTTSDGSTFESRMANRMLLMQRVIEAQELLRKVIDNFELTLFVNAIKHISDPSKEQCPEVRTRKSNLFLTIDIMTIQRILNSCFKHQDNYESQCMAITLINFLEEIRNGKLSQLHDIEYQELTHYVTSMSSIKLAKEIHYLFQDIKLRIIREGVVRNAVELLRMSPRRSRQQELALKMFDACVARSGFNFTHFDKWHQTQFKTLVGENSEFYRHQFLSYFIDLIFTSQKEPKEILSELFFDLDLKTELNYWMLKWIRSWIPEFNLAEALKSQDLRDQLEILDFLTGPTARALIDPSDFLGIVHEEHGQILEDINKIPDLAFFLKYTLKDEEVAAKLSPSAFKLYMALLPQVQAYLTYARAKEHGEKYYQTVIYPNILFKASESLKTQFEVIYFLRIQEELHTQELIPFFSATRSLLLEDGNELALIHEIQKYRNLLFLIHHGVLNERIKNPKLLGSTRRFFNALPACPYSYNRLKILRRRYRSLLEGRVIGTNSQVLQVSIINELMKMPQLKAEKHDALILKMTETELGENVHLFVLELLKEIENLEREEPNSLSQLKEYLEEVERAHRPVAAVRSSVSLFSPPVEKQSRALISKRYDSVKDMYEYLNGEGQELKKDRASLCQFLDERAPEKERNFFAKMIGLEKPIEDLRTLFEISSGVCFWFEAEEQKEIMNLVHLFLNKEAIKENLNVSYDRNEVFNSLLGDWYNEPSLCYNSLIAYAMRHPLFSFLDIEAEMSSAYLITNPDASIREEHRVQLLVIHNLIYHSGLEDPEQIKLEVGNIPLMGNTDEFNARVGEALHAFANTRKAFP